MSPPILRIFWGLANFIEKRAPLWGARFSM